MFDRRCDVSAANPPFRGKFLIVYNPIAGRRNLRRLKDAIAFLTAAGAAVEVYETKGAGDGAKEIRRSARRIATPGNYSAIVSAGGDGTVNEVVNGLMALREWQNSVPPPLGILPLGTTNVLAKELGLPESAEEAAGTLLSGACTDIRVGLANCRFFTVMVGVGLDARVVEDVNQGLKRRIGKAAYAAEVVRQIARFGNHSFRLHIPGQILDFRNAASVVVANGRYYAGKFSCAPEARVEEANLHVCIFEHGGCLNAARYLYGLGIGRLARMSGYHVVRAESLTIEGPEQEPVQADGNIIGRLPVRLSAARQALPVLVGRSRQIPPGPPVCPSASASRPVRRRW